MNTAAAAAVAPTATSRLATLLAAATTTLALLGAIGSIAQYEADAAGPLGAQIAASAGQRAG